MQLQLEYLSGVVCGIILFGHYIWIIDIWVIDMFRGTELGGMGGKNDPKIGVLVSDLNLDTIQEESAPRIGSFMKHDAFGFLSVH